MDKINPTHYKKGKYECFDIQKIIASDIEDPFEGYLLCSVIKYLWRYTHKNGVEDLNKARRFLDELIALQNINILTTIKGEGGDDRS